MRTLGMTLPSGRRVRVRSRGQSASAAADGAAAADETIDGQLVRWGGVLRALTDGRLVVEESGRVLDHEAVLGFSVRDFHALREVATRLGVVRVESDELTCRNCDRDFSFDPARSDVAELEERFENDETPGEREVTLPRPLRLKGGLRAASITMRSVTVRQVLPFWAALARSGPLDVTAALVGALGVIAAGETRDASVLARALSRAPDDVWRAVERGYLELAYSERAFYPAPCPACGALHEVDAPLDRELDPDEPSTAADVATEPFPSEEALEARVERLAPDIYRARGVQNVAIRVEPGVPDVDDAGEPLLGSYVPDASGGGDFLVTIYYRSFRKMWEEDGPYDLDGELRDTIDHELEHHLYYLEGHDPMDAEERREVVADLERVYGKRTLRRYALRGFIADVASFFRATWLLWIVLVIVVGIWIAESAPR